MPSSCQLTRKTPSPLHRQAHSNFDPSYFLLTKADLRPKNRTGALFGKQIFMPQAGIFDGGPFTEQSLQLPSALTSGILLHHQNVLTVMRQERTRPTTSSSAQQIGKPGQICCSITQTNSTGLINIWRTYLSPHALYSRISFKTDTQLTPINWLPVASKESGLISSRSF